MKPFFGNHITRTWWYYMSEEVEEWIQNTLARAGRQAVGRLFQNIRGAESDRSNDVLLREDGTQGKCP